MLGAALLGGCAGLGSDDGGPPPGTVDTRAVPEPVPRDEPPSRYGNAPTYVVRGKRYYTLNNGAGYVERGVASWYGKKFHGRRTSSGEVYDMYAMTAAHRSLPLPTYVRVTNLRNRRAVVVRVNDRGPFHADRLIDLSYAAAERIGMLGAGTAPVEVRALSGTTSARGDAPPAGGRARMYLQAGSFQVRANATRLAARLRSVFGDLVRTSEARAGGRRVYRVRLGPVASAAEADRYSTRLVGLGLERPRVVLE